MAELFDELNKAVSRVQEGAKAFLDKTDIDEKIVDAAKDLKNKAQEALDKTDLDEKLVGAFKDIKGKAQETFEKARPGVEEALNKVGAEAKALFDRGVEAVKGNPAGDAMDEIKKDVAEQVETIRDHRKVKLHGQK